MSDSPRRREGYKRVQAGLVGLAGVVLMVGLANIVIDHANKSDPLPHATAIEGTERDTTSNATTPSEPLAELGVTPAAEAPSARMVPDLQPDPNLDTRMDRDPQR